MSVRADIEAARGSRVRLSRSSTHIVEATSKGGTKYSTRVVEQEPDVLVEQFVAAWPRAADFRPDERRVLYALTRELGSENPDDTADTQVAIVHATLHQVARGSWSHGAFSLLTWHEDPDLRGTFHAQRGCYASTARDGYNDHAVATAAVLEGLADTVRGASSFFDVRAQLAGVQDLSKIKPPEVVAARWRDGGLAWIGPVAGVPSLMFFRRESNSAIRQAAYEAAVEVITKFRRGELSRLDAGMSDTTQAFVAVGALKLGKLLHVL